MDKLKCYLMIMALSVLYVLTLTSVQAQGLGRSRLASALGTAQVQGHKVFVHVWVLVPPGADANEVANAALGQQGARPFNSDKFVTSGLVWDQFLDSSNSNDQVTQYYNPLNDPTGGDGMTALLNTHQTWDVHDSKFSFSYGGPTNRCPSLVKECQGPQTFDGFNDVGWKKLGGCCTLGVTWYSTSIDEADMALNTNFPWSTDGINDFDVETVLLHENGHVAGLGHSEIEEAIMYASYQGVRQILHEDDEDGISFLYPSEGNPEPSDCNDDGICQAGETCENCSDCLGKLNGKPWERFCCGDGTEQSSEGDGSICDGLY